MLVSPKKQIINDFGECVEAQTPVIISASRSTDIPAFYSDWFFYRLDKGHSAWRNPFNGKKHYISYDNAKLIVFWSKNPKPLEQHLHKLKEKEINTYIQFSINNYDYEKIERCVPKVDERIDTFKRLVDILGKGHVVWRNDPLMLSDNITPDVLLERIEYIAEKLKGYTEKLVFSFIDINMYSKVKNNISKLKNNFREFTIEEMLYFTKHLSILNKNWNYELATCGEKIDLAQYDVKNNKCIDDILIARLFSSDLELMEYIGYSKVTQQKSLFDCIESSLSTSFTTKPPKEKGQREACGCIKSKDIGEYNTCIHFCEYCYANSSKERALKSYQQHKQVNFLDTITGR